MFYLCTVSRIGWNVCCTQSLWLMLSWRCCNWVKYIYSHTVLYRCTQVIITKVHTEQSWYKQVCVTLLLFHCTTELLDIWNRCSSSIWTFSINRKYIYTYDSSVLKLCLCFIVAERVRLEKLNIVCVPTSFQVRTTWAIIAMWTNYLATACNIVAFTCIMPSSFFFLVLLKMSSDLQEKNFRH